MTRQKNGTIKMTEDELRSMLVVAWEGKEHYKKLGLDGLAKHYGEAIKRMRTAITAEHVGEIEVNL